MPHQVGTRLEWGTVSRLDGRKCHLRPGAVISSDAGSEPGTRIVEPGTFVPGPKTGTLLAETAIVARGAANSPGGKPALFA